MQTGPASLQRCLVPWKANPGRRLLGAACRRAGPAYGRRRAGAVAVSSSLNDVVAGQDDRDIVALARRRAVLEQPAAESSGGLNEFVRKLRAAWLIFFPERPKPLTPKEEGKRRLRMILVADRCGMSQESLLNMRQNIVRVVADYVDIEAEDLVEVNLSMDPELGTIYSVAVPVKRVKPQARMAMDGEGDPDGIMLTWDPNDMDSDPSGQFPYGA